MKILSCSVQPHRSLYHCRRSFYPSVMFVEHRARKREKRIVKIPAPNGSSHLHIMFILWCALQYKYTFLLLLLISTTYSMFRFSLFNCMIAILNIREKSMLLFFVERSFFSCKKSPGFWYIREKGRGRVSPNKQQRFFL